MSYLEYAYPKNSYINPPSSNKTSKKLEDAVDLITKIIEFAKSTKLWNEIKVNQWTTAGFNDVDIPPVTFKSLDFFGQVSYNDTGDPIGIELNEKNIKGDEKFKQFDVPEFAQVFLLEMGNVKNAPEINEIYNKIDKEKIKKQDFIERIEKLEFNVRSAIIDAYEKGQFNSDAYSKKECIFDINMINFQDYLKDPRGNKHRRDLGKKWLTY